MLEQYKRVIRKHSFIIMLDNFEWKTLQKHTNSKSVNVFLNCAISTVHPLPASMNERVGCREKF